MRLLLLLIWLAWSPLEWLNSPSSSPAPTSAQAAASPSPVASATPLPPNPQKPSGGVLTIQEKRWRDAKIKPIWQISLDKLVARYIRTKDRYEAVEKLRPNGVPSAVAFALHNRESDNDFTKHLHEGSPLTHRTRDAPKGRIPGVPPPYSWLQSAEDAYYGHDQSWRGDRLDLVNWSNTNAGLDKIEGFNGFGYRKRGVPPPYLYSATDQYTSGKYIRDGVYSPTAIDHQAGVVAILKRMEDHGISVPFSQPSDTVHP